MPQIDTYSNVTLTQSTYSGDGDDLAMHASQSGLSKRLSMGKLFELWGGGKFKAAATDPGATNDSTEQYLVGSRWVNTSTGRLFLCTDNTATAATWELVNTLNKLDAAVDPGVSDDNTAGYTIGSLWLNQTDTKVWFCFDASTGAAVWAQAGGGGGTDVYATTETLTNKTWLGSPVYRKLVQITSFPNNSTTNTAHGITGLSAIVEGSIRFYDGTSYFTFDYCARPSDATIERMWCTGTNVSWASGSNRTTTVWAYAVLEYTKV